jgi:hypothetical protein
MTVGKAEVESIDQPFEAKSPRHSRTIETDTRSTEFTRLSKDEK